MQVAITIEGQRGLTWERWKRFVSAVDKLGYAGLYRSDHFLDAEPPDQDSLELWASLTWLASHTKRILFGPLVTPLSFRHPVHTARIAKDVDALSGGRLVLGLGAGWGGGAREHSMFGFDLLDLPKRFDRFEEGLTVITQLLRSDQPVTFDGGYYRLNDAQLLPLPLKKDHPPLLIGGNGPKRVLPLAARFADEWNAIYRTPEQFEQLNNILDQMLDALGRPQGAVKRSQMKGLVFGRDQKDLQKKLNGNSVEGLVERGFVAGTSEQIVEQLGQLSDAGVQQVMLQWNDVDDLTGLEAFSDQVLSQFLY
jgi:F420-dependent oxidoreductase-like protein